MNTENSFSDRFGAIRTINNTVDRKQRSRELMKTTGSDVRSEMTRITGSGTKPVEPEANYGEISRQRGKTRVSTSTKMPATNRVTPPLVTPLVDNGASMEEVLTRILDSMDEQSEQMSQKMKELERAVYVERESLREENNRNGQ